MIIDVTRLTGRLLKKRFPTGVDRVDIEYLRRYRINSIALIRYRGRWLFFSIKESQMLFDILLDSVFSAAWTIRRLVLKRFWISFIHNKPSQKVLLNINHSGLNDTSYADKVALYRLKAYYFIHDCIPLTHPEYSRPGEDVKHHDRLINAMFSGKGLIVNSEDTKSRLESFALSMRLEMPPVAVGHLGFSPVTTDNEAFKIPTAPYFVIIGTIEARKNHLLLLNVWRYIASEMGIGTPKLIIIGQRGWESENAVDMIERCEVIHPFVEEKQHCSDHELTILVRSARALLFPSFTEGYGLPLIEALANGVPVIASDLNVFYEIAGSIPEYLDPIDGIGWMNMILEYAKADSLIRDAQLERMKDFKIPTWNDHFKYVEKVFSELISA